MRYLVNGRCVGQIGSQVEMVAGGRAEPVGGPMSSTAQEAMGVGLGVLRDLGPEGTGIGKSLREIVGNTEYEAWVEQMVDVRDKVWELLKRYEGLLEPWTGGVAIENLKWQWIEAEEVQGPLNANDRYDQDIIDRSRILEHDEEHSSFTDTEHSFDLRRSRRLQPTLKYDPSLPQH